MEQPVIYRNWGLEFFSFLWYGINKSRENIKSTNLEAKMKVVKESFLSNSRKAHLHMEKVALS